MPLADKLRPKSINDMVGQQHLIGENKILRRVIESKNIPNMILYGPPGVGKTSLVNIIANTVNKKCVKLNAVNCGVKDIKDVISVSMKEGHSGIILILDEIQAMNKKQQQSLLECIEGDYVTLIANTSDNPFFTVYKAILSRCSVFEFKPLSKEDVKDGIIRALDKIKEDYESFNVEDKAIDYIAETSNGEMRSALNKLELIITGSYDKNNNGVDITLDRVIEVSPIKLIGYDKGGDIHYDVLSAFHKSCRGSDIDAALHYLARLIVSGDIQGIIRRLLCIASEDVGQACVQAVTIVNSCVQSALQLGFPEARIPLAQATIYLCKCPKSNSVIKAIDNAINDVKSIEFGDVPMHLKDAHYSSAKNLGRGIEYKFPHDYPNHYVKQQYLPDEIKDAVYYIPCSNSQEKAMYDYWCKIKS